MYVHSACFTHTWSALGTSARTCFPICMPALWKRRMARGSFSSAATAIWNGKIDTVLEEGVTRTSGEVLTEVCNLCFTELFINVWQNVKSVLQLNGCRMIYSMPRRCQQLTSNLAKMAFFTAVMSSADSLKPSSWSYTTFKAE